MTNVRHEIWKILHDFTYHVINCIVSRKISTHLISNIRTPFIPGSHGHDLSNMILRETWERYHV